VGNVQSGGVFALNLFLLHAVGDVISPPIIGIMTDRTENALLSGLRAR
jgi:hypothetical protein